MIILNSASKSLEVVLAGAVATTPLPMVSNWLDVSSLDQSISAFGSTDTVVTGTGAVTLVSAPVTNHTRTIKSVSIYNADTTGAAVTVRLNNGTSTRILVDITLTTGSTLEYVE